MPQGLFGHSKYKAIQAYSCAIQYNRRYRVPTWVGGGVTWGSDNANAQIKT
jgi:hypothetical protein